MARLNLSLCLLITILLFSCNRNTGKEPKEEEVAIKTDPSNTTNADPNNITAEEPFKNQPNEFCTIIRKLDVSNYAPDLKIDENKIYPKKYCLLDVCLEHITNSGLIINLGENNENAWATFAVIKVFESENDMLSYSEKYKVRDILMED